MNNNVSGAKFTYFARDPMLFIFQWMLKNYLRVLNNTYSPFDINYHNEALVHDRKTLGYTGEE